MRYSEDHIYEIRSYCREIGLDWELENIPRTKIQADKLLEVYTDCELIHKENYNIALNRDTDNPGRKEDKALNDIDALLEYLHKYDMTQFELIAQLQKYKNDINIYNRPFKVEYIINGIDANIFDELESVKFSKTTITEDILPILKRYYKN